MWHPLVPRVHLCPSEAGLFGLSDLGGQDARRNKGGSPLRLTPCYPRESAPRRQSRSAEIGLLRGSPAASGRGLGRGGREPEEGKWGRAGGAWEAGLR